MAKKLIFIDKEGNVKALCDNVLENIPNFGVREIQRAADVEFNNTKQVWEVILPDGSVVAEHARRDEAIKLEIAHMNGVLRSQL